MLGYSQGTDALRIHSRALQDDIRRLPALDKWPEVLKQVLIDYGLTNAKIGVDLMPYRMYLDLKRDLPGVEFADVSPLWTELTAVKHKVEVDILKEAAKITDLGLEAAVKSVKEGVREYEIAAAAECAMMHAGSEYTPVLPNMISGENFNIYERVASDRKLHDGDVIMFDVTSAYRGYTGDVGYTSVLGRASEKEKEIYSLVLSALNEGVKACRPGVKCSEVDRVVTEILQDSPYGKYQRPGLLGHQLGYGWEHHEPWIGSNVHDTLKPGMVLAIEPGIVAYDQPDSPGAHLEYSMVITDTGNELITTYKFAEGLP